jgi:hypothetical protein
MNPPVVYIGPPKTSTSYLYYAYAACSNYQQLAVKEWRYLNCLYNYGQTSYSDRLGLYQGSAAFHSNWRSIYLSYLAHLDYLAEKPSNDYVLTQLLHTSQLILSRHSLNEYIELFDISPGRFVVDLNPLNGLTSGDFLLELAKRSPGILFVSGFRPFISHIISLLHEVYAWYQWRESTSLDKAVDENIENKYENIYEFGLYVVDVLNATADLYSSSNEEDVETMQRLFAAKALHQKFGETSYEEEVQHRAVNFYLHTNSHLRISKIKICKSNRAGFIPFNSTKISDPDVFSEYLRCHERLGVDLGVVCKEIKKERVRESIGGLIKQIFFENGVKNALLGLEESSANYHKSRLGHGLFRFLFPSINGLNDDWHLTCRRMDEESEKFLRIEEL